MRYIKNISDDEHNLIISWYRISVGEEVAEPDIFFKFIACWISLNAFYNFWCYQNGDRGKEWEKLGYFASGDQFANQTHSKLLQRDNGYKTAIEYLQSRGVRNVENGRVRNISDTSNFKEVILCVYQARNNLFHGEKYVSNMRDFDVVTASHTIVSKFLKAYFEV